MFLLNPQIINGGQTAYTLSRLYEKLPEADREAVFKDKEVLVKAITLTHKEILTDVAEKRSLLIEKISTATNSQTAVTLADRASSDEIHETIQQRLFQDFGILYERKRGEFSEGVKNGYIEPDDIVTRNYFARIYMAVHGLINRSLEKRAYGKLSSSGLLFNAENLEKFVVGFHAFQFLSKGRNFISKRNFVTLLPQTYVASLLANKYQGSLPARGRLAAEAVEDSWHSFLKQSSEKGAGFVRIVLDYKTRAERVEINDARGKYGSIFIADVAKFYQIESGLEDDTSKSASET